MPVPWPCGRKGPTQTDKSQNRGSSRLLPLQRRRRMSDSSLDWLGITGNFILGYSHHCHPTYRSNSQRAARQSDMERRAKSRPMDTLKKALTTEPVLQGPNFTKQLTVHTDASDVGIGGALSQKDETQEDRPVAFFSRKTSFPGRRNYATVEKECLAIVEMIKHFSVYLTGVPFTLVTDHSCLRYLNQMRDTGGKTNKMGPCPTTIQLRSPNTDQEVRMPMLTDLPRQAWEDAPATVQEKRQGSVEDSQPGEPSTDSRLGHLMISSSES